MKHTTINPFIASFLSDGDGSSHRVNALVGNPLIQVCLDESDLGPAELYVGDATFLDESANETLRTPQTLRGADNV